MIVTKRKSMASLIPDTSPTLRIVCNKVIIRACIMDSEMPYFIVWSLSCSILYILVLSLVIFMQSLYTLSEIFHLLDSFHFFTAFSSESYRM